MRSSSMHPTSFAASQLEAFSALSRCWIDRRSSYAAADQVHQDVWKCADDEATSNIAAKSQGAVATDVKRC